MHFLTFSFFYLVPVPGVPYALLPGARCPICNFTWCQVSLKHFYMVPGVPYALLPFARCAICTFTWCQVSHMHFFLVPGVPYALLPGARCPICTFTWCQVTHKHFYLVPWQVSHRPYALLWSGARCWHQVKKVHMGHLAPDKSAYGLWDTLHQVKVFMGNIRVRLTWHHTPHSIPQAILQTNTLPKLTWERNDNYEFQNCHDWEYEYGLWGVLNRQ